MAAGDRTAQLTDMHFDYGRSQVTWQITTIVEFTDGSKQSIDAQTLQKTYDPAVLAGMTVDAVAQDGLTMATSSNPKLASVSVQPALIDVAAVLGTPVKG